MRSSDWLRQEVGRHVAGAGQSEVLSGHWITSCLHSNLGAGIYCWTHQPRIAIYEAGINFEASEPTGIRFDEIEVLKLLDIRTLMLAGKEIGTPVPLEIHTNARNYRIDMHLYLYNTLASILPHMVGRSEFD